MLLVEVTSFHAVISMKSGHKKGGKASRQYQADTGHTALTLWMCKTQIKLNVMICKSFYSIEYSTKKIYVMFKRYCFYIHSMFDASKTFQINGTGATKDTFWNISLVNSNR